MSALLSRIGELLPYSLTSFLDLTAKVVLLVALAALAALVLRRAAAATRHLVWLCALAATLLLPLVSQVIPSHLTAYWQTPMLSAAAPIEAVHPIHDIDDGNSTQTERNDSRADEPATEGVSDAPTTSTIPWGVITIGIYLTGASRHCDTDCFWTRRRPMFAATESGVSRRPRFQQPYLPI